MEEGCYITHFISCGSKNYAYILQKPSGECEQVVKVKGFRLNHAARGIINFNSMRDTLLGLNDDNPPTIHIDRIARTKNFSVITIPETKKYGVVLDKRVYGGPGEPSYPFGYKKRRIDTNDN